MRTLLSLLAAGVVCGLVAPAWGAPEQAGPQFKLPIVAPGPRIKLQFNGGGGVPDFRPLHLSLDSANLFAADALQLQKLLADAHFFELKSSVVKEPPFIPDPSSVYTVTVEMGGRKHTVSWNNGRADLRPLLNWLRARALAREDRPVPYFAPSNWRFLRHAADPDGVTVTITGTLSLWFEIPVQLMDLQFPPRRPLPVQTWWIVRVNGTTYRLDLGASKDLQNAVNKLSGKQVTVTGRLVSGSVRVSGLRAAAVNARPGVRAEVVGTLRYYELERFPVARRWDIAASGKTYQLTFNSAEMQRRATSLAGRRVIVQGELQGGHLIVTDVFALPTPRC